MAIIEIRTKDDLVAPLWWRKFVSSQINSFRARSNSDLFRLIKIEYKLTVIAWDPDDQNSSAKSLEGDEQDISWFILKWS